MILNVFPNMTMMSELAFQLTLTLNLQLTNMTVFPDGDRWAGKSTFERNISLDYLFF